MASKLDRFSRRLILAALFAAGLGLAACGVKGPLEPPPDVEPSEVRDPSPRTPPPDGAAPDRPFILDGLLL